MLMIAGTVCWSVLASGAGLVVVLILNPEADLGPWVGRIAGVINTMIGLLAGFLAGRTDMMQRRRMEDEELRAS